MNSCISALGLPGLRTPQLDSDGLLHLRDGKCAEVKGLVLGPEAKESKLGGAKDIVYCQIGPWQTSSLQHPSISLNQNGPATAESSVHPSC